MRADLRGLGVLLLMPGLGHAGLEHAGLGHAGLGIRGLGPGVASTGGLRAADGRCRRALMEGEVRAGQGFRKDFGGGLELRMEPTAAGWVVRVLPVAGGRPATMDYAGIATPPYRSVSPLLLSTDWGFRAQDAVGWNPRRFRYAANAGEFAAMEAAYQRVTGSSHASAGDEAALADLAGKAPEGVLEIVDASLAPGTSDQTAAAGLLASHFGTTAHRIEPPEGGRATALGRIGWIRFRVKLDLRGSVRVPPGVEVERYSCGRG